jgi:hypothetical protein
VYAWTKANPKRSYGENYASNLALALVRIFLDIWNNAMFYFLLVMTGYWFTFYKL